MISVHPEGKRYAHKITEDGISVVTESHVTDPGVAEQLEDCLAMIRVLTVEEDIHLTYDMDHAVATTIVFLYLSMLLFLVSLVIFFFTITR